MNKLTFHHSFNFKWDGVKYDTISPRKECFDWMNSSENGDVHIFTESLLPTHEKYNCKHKIAWIHEVERIYDYCKRFNHDMFHPFEWIRNNHQHFRYIASCFLSLKDLVGEDRFLYVPASYSRIQREDIGMYEKTKNISIIASNKRWLEGHIMRHQVIEKYGRYMDVFGNGYNSAIDDYGKIYALAPYRFSIIILNCIDEGAFSEALTDAFHVGTIPVYWGTRDIGKHFNDKGIIHFENIDELETILPTLTQELYESKLEYVKDNVEISKQFITSIDWFHDKYKNLIDTL